ncbi:MAG: asparagine synthase B [Deltaproteobacteria bacterium]|nr:MAG: asparagine synthase B [Deltaproteobacteria bacterium]
MCSILAIVDERGGVAALRESALKLSRLQRHRGPDWSGVHATDRALMVHERLSIVDVESGAQPLLSEDGRQALAVNGEIYNHRALREGLAAPVAFRTASDCEVLLPLYREHGEAFLDLLEGMFAFVLWDEDSGSALIARDPIGIIPLYMGRDTEGRLVVASEMKALTPVCGHVEPFPPGHVLNTADGAGPRRWWTRPWRAFEAVTGKPARPEDLRASLEGAVRSHLMSDVPYGVLLSGGLDSSIVAAVAARHAARRVEDGGRTEAWFPRLHSFSIGLEGAPDLEAAAEMAAHIGTVHHGFHYTIQEGLDALRDVIWHIETYDVTSIRASTPMFLMARRIRAMGIKMVLSGEGADEIFGGYLYFHRAPDARALHEETVRKLDALHLYDCLRANKSMAAWGVEARVPFLDTRFLDVAMGIDPEAKRVGPGRMEKQILRDAFADLLPERIVRRQKEQFSDGVGYGWIDALRAFAEAQVTDRDLANAQWRYPHNTPTTKEALFYRRIFEEHFPLPAAAATVPGGPSVACSTAAAIAWDASFGELADPSGRAVRGVHVDSYED